MPSGSAPGKIYGLVKVHKKDSSLRPVVSMVGTPEYELAKFLDKIIKPYISNNFMLESTNDFISKVNQFQFSSNDKLVSFDVTSLFTNVPLNETIRLIADTIYSKENPNLLPCDRDTFVKLLRIATTRIFMNKDKLFQQIDGVAVISPLGPTLPNFFSAKMDKKIMSIASAIHPLLYLRYVDDIFAVFEINKSCLKFLDILNSQHKNIKLTVEYGSELMWRKTTRTGILVNFDALCPLKWKSGLILCLLNRAKAICSSKLLF